MTDERAQTSFLQYPSAQAYDKPYKAPEAYNNPTVKGYTLHCLTSLVTGLPLVSHILWKNAGFGSLRALRELNDVEPRYDPTVTPLPEKETSSPLNYTKVDVSTLRTLPQNAPGRFYSIADYYEAYRSGRLTPTDVVEFLLPLIRRDVEKRSPYSAAFVDSKLELIREAAEASTKRWREGKPLGVLDGIPFTVKDEVDVKGYKRYVGTKYDYTEGKEVGTSWCVRKVEEEGGIMIGKNNMHEMGMDTNGNNPNWGTPLNPYNSSYYPGGSSSGGASTVGAGLVPFALGSDGGGSVRIPSNYCGLYGLKTSHGRVSISPLPRSGNSVVINGPLTSNMSDLEIYYRVLAQPDPSHEQSSRFSPPKRITAARNKVLGICKPWFDRAVPAVQEACTAALQYLTTEHGYTVIDIHIPYLTEGQTAHALTILSEVLAEQPDLSILTDPNRVLLKVAQSSTAFDYIIAQRVRNAIMQHLAHLFTQHPGLIIVTPTTPNAGWPIGDGEAAYGVTDGNMQVFNMEYVWLANFTGVPCLQVPVGYVDGVKGKGKVPIGMMGHGDWGSEDELIEFGFDAEDWLNNGYAGGKLRPEAWVDVLEGSEKGRAA